MAVSIISYNVNGIRSATRKGLWDWMEQVDPDVVCFQETKAWQADIEKEVKLPEGYQQYWYSAQKKGYSGVGILSKVEPNHVEYGCGIDRYDYEGRVIRADFDNFSVVSLYLPSGSSGDERQAFKDEFLDDFYHYARELRDEIPHLVISGDYNICHQAIDIHNPVSNKNSSGFLEHERKWVSSFLELGYVDSFRKVNPDPDHYTWWSFRAQSRARNKGWRIDYHMVTDHLNDKIIDHVIHTGAVHSDHAPIELKLDV